MTMEALPQDLADFLVTRNFDPEYFDDKGQPAEAGDAKTMKFDYVASSGKNYGTAVCVIADNELSLFYGDNLGRGMEPEDKEDWFSFLEQLSNTAASHSATWSPRDINQLKHTLAGIAAIKEGLFEGYYGTRKISYMGEQTQARLVIKHNRVLGEDDKRYRYVESLFIETAEQERFRLPFKSLSAGRAMLEHVRSGGNPYDVRGNHITEVVSEMAVLSRFNRAQHHRVYEGVTQQLVESAQQYYRNLQETMKHLGSPRGYQAYFESWAPDQTGEAEALVENLRDLFVEQTLDARIEAALPTLAKIQQQGNNMKEAQIFENWVNALGESHWALPETPEQLEKLNQLMSAELIVGPDATNAKELLGDIVGDDELFSILDDLADNDPRANIWDDSDVQRRLAELGVQTPQSTETAPAAVPQDTAPAVAEGWAKNALAGAALAGAGALGSAAIQNHNLSTHSHDAKKPAAVKVAPTADRTQKDISNYKLPSQDEIDKRLTGGYKLPSQDEIDKRLTGGYKFNPAKAELPPRNMRYNEATQGMAEESGDSQITPGMKTQYGTVVSVEGNTVTVKASNGELTTVNIHDIEQGVAEGSDNKYSNLSNRGVNRGINRAADDFDRMMDLDQAESPHYKTQHQQDTKQRLKTKPMTGPKGVLPEQGMAEAVHIDVDLVRAVFYVAKEIYDGAKVGNDMTDTIVDELGDYFDDVEQSGLPKLKKAYAAMRATADEDPSKQKRAAGDALLRLNTLIRQGMAEGDNMATFEQDRELAEMLKHAGVPIKENVLTDSTGNTWDHLLDRFRHEVENFKQSGNLDDDLYDDLYDALYDYYSQHGAMPYRVQKAKDGSARQWVSKHLSDDLGLDEGVLGAALGGIAGAAITKSPAGASVGSSIGDAITDEGWKGALTGAALGGALGSIVPGLGTIQGAIAGGYAGHRLGDEGLADPDKEYNARQKLQTQQPKPVSEGSCNMTMEGEYCPEHGLMECGSMYETQAPHPKELEMDALVRSMQIQNRADNAEHRLAQRAAEPHTLGQKIKQDIGNPLGKLFKGDIKGALGEDDPMNSNSAMTGSYYEGKETKTQEGDALLARIKSLALLR